MCVIIDASIAPLLFRNPPDKNFLPVSNWLHDPNKDGRLVYGGRLTQELFRVESTRRYLRALQQAGKAFLIPDRAISAEEAHVIALRLCRSNDPHVIALARISGARTLCSDDEDLHHDFKNLRLIKPKGYVYQEPGHAHLLRHTKSCGQVRRRS